jgi:penicillin-binding protein 2
MNPRLFLVLALVYGVFGVFALRLWQLQVVQHQQYATRSEGNYLRTEAILPPRGRILDRGAKVLASNRLAVDLEYSGGEILYRDRILQLIGLNELPQPPKGQLVTLKVNIADNLVPSLAELAAGQDNLRLVERSERVYPNDIAGPLIGYTQLASKEQVEQGYYAAELVGTTGVEGAMEAQLRGIHGVQFAEVNIRGERVRRQVLKEPEAGSDIYLTLDYSLQKAAQRILGEGLQDLNQGRALYRQPAEKAIKGAMVALDPRNGEVLVMATIPTFDPNLFGKRPRDNAAIAKLFSDKTRPTLNRAVTDFQPASTFKLATSSALLESGRVTPGTSYGCSSVIYFGGNPRRNWSNRNMGPMTSRDAIANSCNTWYYQSAAYSPGGPVAFVDILAKRSMELGLGRPTGLEVTEQEGLIPTLEWKRQNFKDGKWYPGETLSIVIGQSYVQATPAQIARMLTTIANSGRQPELHLVRQIGDQPVAPQYTQVPGRFWSDLQAGLRQTVTRGTASHILGPNRFPVPTAGKTGTGQNELSAKLGNAYTHAWYMGYGPVSESGQLITTDSRRPPLVAVAFFENAGEGSGVALPAVRKLMASYWQVEQ